MTEEKNKTEKKKTTKTKKTILIVGVSVLVLILTAGVVLAATNTSKIEKLYYEFRDEQVNGAVDSGDMTQEQADTYLEKLSERMDEDEKDAVPPIGSDRRQDRRAAMRRSTLKLYAEISGQEAEEIIETLKEEEISLFKMADDAGLLDELKEAMIEDAFAHIDQKVEDGKLDADKAEEIKAEVEERINAITADTKPPIGKNIGGNGGAKGGGPRDGGQGPCND